MRSVLLSGLFSLCLPLLAAEATIVPLPSEAGSIAPWRIADDDGGMSSWVEGGGSSGKGAFRVEDASEKGGSSLWSPKLPVKGGESYQIRFSSRLVGGDGIALYVMSYDDKGKETDLQKEGGLLMIPPGGWKETVATLLLPENAVEVAFWLHSFGKAKVTAELERVDVKRVDPADFKPRWAPQYRIHPDEKERLTEADVVGPDGIVYPNWKNVGVRGGIPSVPVVTRIRAAEGSDLADEIDKAVASLSGPGAILLPSGTFRLSRTVQIRKSGVVLRGAGREATRIVFDYEVPEGKVVFPYLKDGQKVGQAQAIEFHAKPEGLTNLSLECEGKVLGSTTYYAAHWGLTFSMRVGVGKVISAAGAGSRTLVAKARYKDGSAVEGRIELEVVDSSLGEPSAMYPAAIEFIGQPKNPEDAPVPLAKDGKRGSRTLTLRKEHGLRKGDAVRLEAPATARWNALVKNAAPWGTYRENIYVVEEVRGDEIVISEPLRIDFPTVDGAFVQRMRALERCGVESLTLEQTKNVWTSGVVFSTVVDAWLRDVHVVKAGRFPFYMPLVKYGEIRDCAFDDAWWKGGGGTAYVGFERSYDCLLTDVRTSALRHAPNLNWAAAGNVFRDSVFVGSDGQWHCGWAHENLFENVKVASGTEGGGYGYGLFSTEPSDSAHGPIGPRNVVWNCEVKSPKDGLILNGMNEGWIVAYNRFAVAKGRAITAKEHSIDHVIRGNLFEIGELNAPAIRLGTPDCSGWEIEGNLFKGAEEKKWIGGAARALKVQGNRSVAKDEEAAKPAPPVPSIFLWQKSRP